MVEKTIYVLQRVLKKITVDPKQWPSSIEKATFEVNKREIPHLTYSLSQILCGFNPVVSLETSYPVMRRKSLSSIMKEDLSSVILEEGEHSDRVIELCANRVKVREKYLERSNF
ncbi:hypothetical protein GcM1_099002 [Golovinomyces cichoracearum]|uniref:Uncharacterized protein n=1 Tax=Golovinomyces cichoracearum TaxID=62708 RepID=A0A420JCA4_9PEZI|nr:hypothetical protein GcM1_099002 [Golovinomyces cichoracearum]